MERSPDHWMTEARQVLVDPVPLYWTPAEITAFIIRHSDHSYLMADPPFRISHNNLTMAKKKHYYIQNGYLGNVAFWWKRGSAGYTADIHQAGRYTTDEAKIICKDQQHRAWPCDYIDWHETARMVVLDSQYLDHKECPKWGALRPTKKQRP